MIDCFEQTQYNPIMVEPVVVELVNQIGIADVNGVKVQPGDSTKINDMVGKPQLDEAPSYYRPLRVIRNNWDLLATTTPGAGGVIQLNDALHQLPKLEPPCSAFPLV